MVKSLKNRIVGLRLYKVYLRLANIFDINSRTYVFKFSKNEKKECLIIENGVRIHCTD